MKQTAVQWLIEQLENHNGVTRAGFNKCIQEAIEMEKWQIMEACYSVLMNKDKHNMIPICETKEEEIIRHGQGYYNITFKKYEI